jgi:hypothetical protein
VIHGMNCEEWECGDVCLASIFVSVITGITVLLHDAK